MIVKLTTETDYRNRTMQKKARSGSAVATEPVRSPFLDILEEILPVSDLTNQDLHELWAELPDIEKKLIENPSTENLGRYRTTVMEIARQTLQKNVRVKQLFRKNRHNEKVELNIIEILDERLHKMALMIQSPENSAFSILKGLDEIRGLLLDIQE